MLRDTISTTLTSVFYHRDVWSQVADFSEDKWGTIYKQTSLDTKLECKVTPGRAGC